MSLVRILSNILPNDIAEKIVNIAIIDNAYKLLDNELYGSFSERSFNHYVNIIRITLLLKTIAKIDKIDNKMANKVQHWMIFNHWLNEYIGCGFVYDKELYNEIHILLGMEIYNMDIYLNVLHDFNYFLSNIYYNL